MCSFSHSCVVSLGKLTHSAISFHLNKETGTNNLSLYFFSFISQFTFLQEIYPRILSLNIFYVWFSFFCDVFFFLDENFMELWILFSAAYLNMNGIISISTQRAYNVICWKSPRVSFFDRSLSFNFITTLPERVFVDLTSLHFL